MTQTDIDSELFVLARAHRILARHGHRNMSLGHMSLRDPGERGFWLKRAGLGFEEVQVEDFILLDLNGQQLAGNGRRHSEWPIHAEIFRERPEVRCVVHSHPIHATVFSCGDVDLACVCQEGIMLHGRLSYFRKMKGLIRTADQGRELARALGEKSAIFMKAHGITACGSSIEQTTLWAIFVERAAQAHLLAASAGSDFAWSGPLAEDLAVGGAAHMAMADPILDDFWSYFSRELDHAERCP